jgi:purine-nucleoside phosphorylase
LGGIADEMEVEARISYEEIPGLPVSTVAGHANYLIIGRLSGAHVAALAGRSHYYEHGDAPVAARGICLLHALGCQSVYLTAAAGGLNPEFQVGDLMLVTDHICLPALSGQSPLLGDTGDGRFVPMSEAYAPELRRLMKLAANHERINLLEGVYAQAAGPQYETAAEQRLLRRLGADAVGMSVATETIMARRLGLKVLAVVCITNIAGSEVTHTEVVAASRNAKERLVILLRRFILETL